MIILSEVAKKLQSILDGTDTEANAIANFNNAPDFEFLVATQGFHLDKINNNKTGRNFIPVFIGSMGGQNNPVPKLKQQIRIIPITFYFPVRFKDDFFAFEDYLGELFIGQKLTYGTISGKAVSNISIAQYGELQDIDLKEFITWTTTVYQRTIERMEPYWSLTINLYLSSIADGYFFGNDAKISLSVEGDDEELVDNDVVFDNGSIQSQSQANSEQELGTSESQALPFGTSYGVSFIVYYKDTKLYNHIVDSWFAGTSQTLALSLSVSIGTHIFSRRCFIESVNMQIQKGEPITITLTYGKLIGGNDNA